MSKLRLRRSVGVVITEQYIDFFKSNTRESLLLKMKNPQIIDLLQNFDGKTNTDEIVLKNPYIDKVQFMKLISYLEKEYILINQDISYPVELMKNIRLINILEEYCHSTSEVINKINALKNKRVMIIGLGAVGSLVSIQLAQLGVGNLIFVDKDRVDETNLHRQYYFEDQIGRYKANVIQREINNINSQCNIEIIPEFLTEDFFYKHDFSNKKIDLIINCADEPNVDITSRIVSRYGMDNNIPHIVGGGYNLHLTLIGQTIVPFKTACFECFNLFLKELNESSLKNVKKLHRDNRKLGSFSPLSGIASNLASLDAFKILIEKIDNLQQANRRIEFNVKTHNFSIMNVNRYKECEWCGNER